MQDDADDGRYAWRTCHFSFSAVADIRWRQADHRTGPQDLLLNCTDGCRAFFQRPGRLFPPGLSVEVGHVLKVRGDVGMVRGKGLLPDCQRTLVERFSLRIPVLDVVEQREIVQRRGDIGMIGAECLLRDCQRAFVERLGQPVTALDGTVPQGCSGRWRHRDDPDRERFLRISSERL